MCLHYILVGLLENCCNGNATKCSIFIVSGVNVTVNITKTFSVVTEIQNWFPIALLSNNKKYFLFLSKIIITNYDPVCLFYYPACKSHFSYDVPYCHFWSVSLVFPHYVINGAFLDKKIEHRICFDFPYSV